MDFWLCFTCPAHFCELLSGDLGSSAIFLENLIGQVLQRFPLIAVAVAVELDFSLSESMYFLHIHIRCSAHFATISYEPEVVKLEIEDVVSQVLLQCFWEVYYSEC